MKNELEIKQYTEYCLNCKIKPCQKGCPLSNDIPTFIKLTKEGNLKQAYTVLAKTTMIGSVCGRICPHENQCRGECVRGIKGEAVNIGEIEAYVFDQAIKNKYYKELPRTNELKEKNIAVIGSGPSGLNCSAFLALAGANVTIYEKYDELGGILRHGIPDFRLEKQVLDYTIDQILNLGVKVKSNQTLGQNLSIEELKKSCDAIFIAIGTNIPNKMNIQGEELQGVYGGNTLLETKNHPDYTGKSVAIIGGGNVAMDCARTIKRKGASKVSVIYRRAEEQMPATKKEIADSKKEGIEFLFKTNIVKILGKDRVEKIECIKTELVKKEGESREVPIEIKDSNYILDMDYVIMAVGCSPNVKLLNELDLELTEKGYIKVNEKYQTSDKKIYAGGDLIGQKATVAWAAMAGREAAKSMIKELSK